MPAIFVGHGNPMLAITSNPWREAWLQLGREFGSSPTHQWPQPRAILCVSAHWVTQGTWVCNATQPKTIHDFGGFPSKLFMQQYTAPGAPELAQEIEDLLGLQVKQTSNWGLDHGAWSVLQSLFPQAQVPVCQLSLGRNRSMQEHADLAHLLRPLRERGVLILGSGNVTHNLHEISLGPTPEWAKTFDSYVAQALIDKNQNALLENVKQHPGWRLSAPTPEHYWPLIYISAQHTSNDQLHFFNEGFDLGSLSMRSFVLS